MVGFIGFLCIAGSAGLLIFGLRQFRKFRIVSGKNPMRIGSVRGGFFEFRGKVTPMTLTRSPFSGTECVYYRFHEEEWVEPDAFSTGRSRRSGGWRTSRDEEHAVEFLLEDGTGTARVLPDGADWHLKVDIDRARSTDPSAGGFKWAFGQRVASDKRRTTETYVVPGDTLHVIATARPSSTRDGASASRITLSGDGAPIFLITDKPKGELVGRLQLLAFASWAGSVLLLAIPIVGVLFTRAMRLPH